MFDKKLVEHCSAVLAGLKTANLFSYSVCPGDDLRQIIASRNLCLNPKGITLFILKETNQNALIYVCRVGRLSADLKRECVKSFLKKYGYTEFDAPGAIYKLKERLNESESFPHEIGLFLGYPFEDVKGFIENSGKNCKYCGYWKVYEHETEKQKLFQKFNKCREVYTRLFHSQVRSVQQLTVAAYE